MNKYIISCTFIILIALTTGFVYSQTFLNGNFEKHKVQPGVDEINLSNADFNSKMENTFAFGTYGDVDIISTATYCGLAQDGSWYVALTGGGTDAISMELSSELVKGRTYNISFWDRGCTGFVPQPIQIGVSDKKDALGTAVYTAPMPELSIWTKRTCTFEAPVDGKYITVQLSGANNIGQWAQVDNFSFGSTENVITTGTVNGNSFCACSSILIPFTSSGKFKENNIYTAQLSDAGGSFANAVNIGKLKSNENSGSIDCIIPCGTLFGSSYKVRVISTGPEVTGSDNGEYLAIHTGIHPSVRIAAVPGTTVYEGTSVTFTASCSNAGFNVSYQWQVNGLNAGNHAAFFTSESLKNGDVVSLVITTNSPCASSSSAISNALTMTIIPDVTSSVTITSNSGEMIKKGTAVTFKAFVENGGANPSYHWKVNGKDAGGNTSTFTTAALNDGDVINLVVTTNSNHPQEVISNAITMSVNANKSTVIAKANHSKTKFRIFSFRFRKQYAMLQNVYYKRSFSKLANRNRSRIKKCYSFS